MQVTLEKSPSLELISTLKPDTRLIASFLPQEPQERAVFFICSQNSAKGWEVQHGEDRIGSFFWQGQGACFRLLRQDFVLYVLVQQISQGGYILELLQEIGKQQKGHFFLLSVKGWYQGQYYDGPLLHGYDEKILSYVPMGVQAALLCELKGSLGLDISEFSKRIEDQDVTLRQSFQDAIEEMIGDAKSFFVRIDLKQLDPLFCAAILGLLRSVYLEEEIYVHLLDPNPKFRRLLKALGMKQAARSSERDTFFDLLPFLALGQREHWERICKELAGKSDLYREFI